MLSSTLTDTIFILQCMSLRLQKILVFIVTLLMSRRRQPGTIVARRRQAHEAAHDPLIALVTLRMTTFMSTLRGTYESYLQARSAATPKLDEFFGREVFGNFAFNAFCARNNGLIHTFRLSVGLGMKCCR